MPTLTEMIQLPYLKGGNLLTEARLLGVYRSGD